MHASIFRFDLHGKALRGSMSVGPIESTYLTMRDGVRIALDIVRPMDEAGSTKRDTILVMTRYWRGVRGTLSNEYADLFVPHGYAVVVGDVRGTGASFGVWPHPRARAETADFSEVLDWIATQPWSSGRVVGYGLSYTANTSDWMAERNHPALKGIIPRFADYDPYEDEFFPGGIPNASFGRDWSNGNKNLDCNVRISPDGDRSPGVRPVGERGEEDLVSALREHDAVPSLWEGFQQVTFKDDRPASWEGDSMLDWSIEQVANRVSRAGTPTQNWAGWFDGGTAQGAIRRFLRQTNPMNIIIGPWGHGAFEARDPLRSDGELILPTTPIQEANDIRFADMCFSDQAGHHGGKALHYYTLGEGTWKTTPTWPPTSTRWRLYTGSGFSLRESPDETGFDELQVIPALGDPSPTRWDFARTVNFPGDHRRLEAAGLAYIGEPLRRDLEITGHPIVKLTISSTREDGNFFVYLQAVAPDGTSCYLTEGQLRALHRKVLLDSQCHVLGPQHSYLKRDAKPLIPGKPAILTFSLLPISARIPAGYRLRVVFTGSDAPTFINVPTHGPAPNVQFHKGAEGCYVDLPIVHS
ncbi:family S15 peptidase [Mesorhizobium sp. SARCC-RB16n]|nr:family S15 peptidase [Mesorhizobium sp. SARCC-RB16n]